MTTANCDDIERLTNWDQGRMSYELKVANTSGTEVNGYFYEHSVCTRSGSALDYTYTIATGLVTIACPTYVRGDVNMDGAVNSADVTALTSILLGEQAETELSDVNDDGMVSIADISELIGLLLAQ